MNARPTETTSMPAAASPGGSPGARLRQLRRAAGLTQAELARLAGLAQPNTVSRWERNRSLPQRSQVRSLATRFQISPAQLQSFIDEGEPADLPTQLERFSEAPVIEVSSGAVARALSSVSGRVKSISPADAQDSQQNSRGRFVVKGDAMEPDFRAGDIVLLGEARSPQDVRDGQPIVALGSDGRMVFGYAYLVKSRIEIRPVKHTHRTRAFRQDDSPVLLPVVEMRRFFAT